MFQNPQMPSPWLQVQNGQNPQGPMLAQATPAAVAASFRNALGTGGPTMPMLPNQTAQPTPVPVDMRQSPPLDQTITKNLKKFRGY